VNVLVIVALVWSGLALGLTWALARWFRYLRDN
jgi:hypothetical protein